MPSKIIFANPEHPNKTSRTLFEDFCKGDLVVGDGSAVRAGKGHGALLVTLTKDVMSADVLLLPFASGSFIFMQFPYS